MARNLNTFQWVYHVFSSIVTWSDGCRSLAVIAIGKAELNPCSLEQGREIMALKRSIQSDTAMPYLQMTP